MKINITDQIVSAFLSGLIAVLVVIAVGALISFILRGIAKRFPFTRIALVIALAPMSLFNFLEPNAGAALIIYAMIATLLGIAIDGINHLLMPRERIKHEQPRAVAIEKQEEEPESRPGMIVWEKAE